MWELLLNSVHGVSCHLSQNSGAFAKVRIKSKYNIYIYLKLDFHSDFVSKYERPPGEPSFAEAEEGSQFK